MNDEKQAGRKQSERQKRTAEMMRIMMMMDVRGTCQDVHDVLN